MSFGPLRDMTVFGLTVFDLFDYVSSNILLPLGGMMISIFVGWFVDRGILRTQLRGTESYYSNIAQHRIPEATNDTSILCKEAKSALATIFRPCK